jgi:uncharacterized SAM-binding protein YcdF (DUF218 family)
MGMKKIIIIVSTILAIGIIYAIVCFGFIMSEHNAKPDANPDSIVVLGAQVKGKTAETAYPSNVLKERLVAATDYAKEHPDAQIIVSGGQGKDEPISEAAMMSKYLGEHGVMNPIIEEMRSMNTNQNLLNSKEITKLGRTVVVTSDFHVYRSLLLAKRSGLKHVSALAAKSKSSATLRLYFREIIAVGKTFIFGH